MNSAYDAAQENIPIAQERMDKIQTERIFNRFTRAQRWEHALLIVSFTTLVLTGLPRKYFDLWGHFILATPQTVELFRTIHLAAAVVLTLEVVYHLGRALFLLARRKLSAGIFFTWQDVRDAGQMVKYLLFLSNQKPSFGKYNFEQKITYWFLFFGIGIMVITGFILWFPVTWTHIFPGGIVPAARLAHSDEAIIATIFLIIWHLYHVHVERLNLSIFTGRLNERDMRTFHAKEFQRLIGETTGSVEGSTLPDKRSE